MATIPSASVEQSFWMPTAGHVAAASVPQGCGACLNCGAGVPLHPQWLYCTRCVEAVGPIAMQDSDSFSSVPQEAASPAAGVDWPASRMCQSCGSKAVAAGTTCCSKRCSWFAQLRCPQCGRERNANYVYCCGGCASQATQANWCMACGVRQMASGGNSCGDSACSITVRMGTSASVGRGISRGLSRKSLAHPRHELLPREDKVRQSIATQFAYAVVPPALVLGVIKIVPDAQRRKEYLAYRAQVERSMSQNRASKYGHGGEGNELRRYFPLTLCCGMHGALTPRGTLQYCPGASDDPSTGIRCEVCSIMQRGFSMDWSHRGSHYGQSTCAASLPWCPPNDSGVKAVAVARVVVGSAQIINMTADAAEPPAINIPENPDTTHSVIVTDGDTNYDGTYVFRDDAADAQFIVLFQ